MTQFSESSQELMSDERIPKASGFFPTPDGKKVEIRDVWAANLAEEMANIRDILEKYPYVAMVSKP